ncbi:hypothetical protein QQ045_003852 [Rhodiola kirilowii]
MSKTIFSSLLVFMLLHVCFAARDLASVSSPLADLGRLETRTLTVGPKRREGEFFNDKEVKGCLPKGFRRASAPSRFANFHTLRWTGCHASESSKQP